MSSRVWFITGCSRGLGYALAQEVLENGEQLVLTARNLSRVQGLVAQYPERCFPLSLDVTQGEQIVDAVQKAFERFGRIDVLVNNAGYGLVGPCEESSQEQIRKMYETHVFGPLSLMHSVLPIMRKQGSGHIFNISSIVGYNNQPGFSIYGSSKCALEGISESLFWELRPFGILVTIIEPGPFRTDFAGISLEETAHCIDDYQGSAKDLRVFLRSRSGKEPGDPLLAAKVIRKLVLNTRLPLRIPLGVYAFRQMHKKIRFVKNNLKQCLLLDLNADFS